MTERQRFYGKYRGTVVNTLDPLQIGRIQVLVPAVGGLAPSTWALPCVPLAGPQTGFHALPPVGAGVWIEFEGGDPDFPIWTGCFWGSVAEVPALALATPPPVPAITLQTPLQNGITISDLPGPTGGVLIKTATGAFISVSEVGITLSNGKGATITLTGPTVDVNVGALTVL
jgi:hypothetical protein